jgi:ethanolamine utilization protein EutA
LVAVTSQDVGKALGMELFRLVPGRELLIIDEVHTRAGDYLDIGKSYFNGGTIPVTVKSLAFPH